MSNNTTFRVFIFIAVACVYLNSNETFSQEWKSLKLYQKKTSKTTLQEGCWLKKDRIEQNDLWNNANIYNLSIKNGFEKYKTISQKRDFYKWFDSAQKKQGHEIKWIGIAAIAAGQLSKLDNGFIRFFIVRNKEVVQFANEGSEIVFEFAFPLFNNLYFSNEPLTGQNAINWSLKFGEIEQCKLLDPLYHNLSKAAVQKLNRMAKGKGIFKLGVPKQLRYEGSIEDCNARIHHASTKMLSFYLNNSES